MPVEDLTFGANGSFDSAEKKFSINFSKANTKFSWVLNHDDGQGCIDISINVATVWNFTGSFENLGS